jgi:hypothetical protein
MTHLITALAQSQEQYRTITPQGKMAPCSILAGKESKVIPTDIMIVTVTKPVVWEQPSPPKYAIKRPQMVILEA